jgi:hypothetical protein
LICFYLSLQFYNDGIIDEINESYRRLSNIKNQVNQLWNTLPHFSVPLLRNETFNLGFERIVSLYNWPWILRFSSRIEFRSFRGSRRITDKTETQKVQKRVRTSIKNDVWINIPEPKKILSLPATADMDF